MREQEVKGDAVAFDIVDGGCRLASAASPVKEKGAGSIRSQDLRGKE